MPTTLSPPMLQSEVKPVAPRRSIATHQSTETIPMPGSENVPPIPVIKHYAEKQGFVTVHNWKMHYRICYPTFDPAHRVNGNGRNIILFHGALSNLGTWRKIQQTLADRTGCRVLSYDRVGHGLSEKPATWPKNANPYKNGGVLAISQTLLETLGMQQNLILIGNGTGATIASAIALSKPNAVRGLVLIAPAILDEAPPPYLHACVSYPPPLGWVYRQLYGDHGPLQQFYYKSKPMMADKSTEEMYMRPTKDEGFWRGLSNATKYRTSYKIEQHLDRLTEFSTLVMTGDVDDVVPTIETLRLFETLQSARQLNVPQVLKMIKQSGHLPQEEKPGEFVKVVSFFVRKVCLGSLSRERSLGRRVSGSVVRSASKRFQSGQSEDGLSNTIVNSTNNDGTQLNTATLMRANTQANANISRSRVVGLSVAGPLSGRPGVGAPLMIDPPTQMQRFNRQTRQAPGEMIPLARNDPMTRGRPTIAISQAAPLPPLTIQQPIQSY